ncbi:MAG: hypothetical protein COW21_04235 [Candidatus Aenigmarchaeota archaeon CG15_BIG_FIL_POST_REV_8_21_14_020_37_27]|nr:MAG: hypothetical protein COW21_04235 [Candidatus Aenigmarchaeota archaeon CG15_BIG_FIL_POST_REV_8_21_14_020_37_27]
MRSKEDIIMILLVIISMLLLFLIFSVQQKYKGYVTLVQNMKITTTSTMTTIQTTTSITTTTTTIPQETTTTTTSTAHDHEEKSRTENLTVHFIDVGQGDSILIEQNDKFILIDCGRSSTKVVNYLRNQGVFELEYLLATHPDADHIGGCDDVLENFDVLHVWDNGQTHDTQAYQDYIILAKNRDYSVVYRGNKTDYFNMEILSPPQGLISSDMNENSIVTKLSFGNIDFLFTGDCKSECEQDILNIDISIDSEILKIAHHGSKYSTTDDFLEAVNPDVAVISVGANNPYGHPTQIVLDKLSSRNIKTHRTDIEGNVIITTDGETYFIDIESSTIILTTTMTTSTALSMTTKSTTASTTTILSSENVVIYDVLYDPLGQEPDNERITLRNNEKQTVDVGGWMLTDGEGNYIIPEGTIIIPYQIWNVYGYQYNPTGYTRGLYLANSGDCVYLYDINNRLVDSECW